MLSLSTRPVHPGRPPHLTWYAQARLYPLPSKPFWPLWYGLIMSAQKTAVVLGLASCTIRDSSLIACAMSSALVLPERAVRESRKAPRTSSNPKAM